MFSTDQFLDISTLVDEQTFAESTLRSFAEQHRLQAILIVCSDLGHNSMRVQWAFNVPNEPFNGADNACICEAITECFKIHPKPHVHAMKNEKDVLTSRICRYNRALQEQHRMWFIPIRRKDAHFVFLGFPLPGEAKSITSTTLHQLAATVHLLGVCAEAGMLRSRTEVTERFVKEIGHDLASTVQAAVAKIRTITDGRVSGDGIRHKVKEIEQQIWDSYRIAESLGIVVDSNYELRQPEDFDLRDAVKRVLRHFAGEASERHIKFKFDLPNQAAIGWGDKAAVEQALGQLISNAIKYTFGGSEIGVVVTKTRDDVTLCVKNKALIPLPIGAELQQIWDFGFRGEAAKEKHVNGSGIGLYSAKKIVIAHRGWVTAESSGGYTFFSIHLPSREALKKELGVLL
jgi:signal transduction histidine kinase